MKDEKREKILIAISLIAAIITLTVGFAAFSNTLTISSSAQVTPNESDFDINVYGIGDWQGVKGYPFLEQYTSKTISIANKGLNNTPAAISATDAKITDNGKNITISDINVGLSHPGQSASYFFMIKNEGKYDAYLDMTDIEVNSFNLPIEGTCTAEEGATESLVEQACSYIWMSKILTDSDNYGFTGGDYVKIAKGDYLQLELNIFYYPQGTYADGNFNVAFDDITFEFTSIPPSE